MDWSVLLWIVLGLAFGYALGHFLAPPSFLPPPRPRLRGVVKQGRKGRWYAEVRNPESGMAIAMVCGAHATRADALAELRILSVSEVTLPREVPETVR